VLPAARLDVNAATAGELESLPGIGPALAEAIVADRRAHGPFPGAVGLTRVKGVGPAIARGVMPYVR
jgi:competence protein ComEA